MTSNAYYASQNRMNETIEVIFKEIFKKIANCARFYEINRNILSRKLHEKNFWSARVIFNKCLINVEKHSLIIYIRYCDEKNLSITLKLLIEVIIFLIYARNFSAKLIENIWFERFLKRHFKMKKRCTTFILTECKDVYEFKK